ncbi:MAG: hypothetical protein J2P30_00190 [Actinobacteria bacterium]|nr:hypothetical protein [Actinomycetota bacterium]
MKVAPGVRYHSSKSTGCAPIGLGTIAVAAAISLLWNYWYIVVPVLVALGVLVAAARLRVKRR